MLVSLNVQKMTSLKLPKIQLTRSDECCRSSTRGCAKPRERLTWPTENRWTDSSWLRAQEMCSTAPTNPVCWWTPGRNPQNFTCQLRVRSLNCTQLKNSLKYAFTKRTNLRRWIWTVEVDRECQTKTCKDSFQVVRGLGIYRTQRFEEHFWANENTCDQIYATMSWLEKKSKKQEDCTDITGVAWIVRLNLSPATIT
jgi:predicted DNA-binding ribbon-helix-helix protein